MRGYWQSKQKETTHSRQDSGRTWRLDVFRFLRRTVESERRSVTACSVFAQALNRFGYAHTIFVRQTLVNRKKNEIIVQNICVLEGASWNVWMAYAAPCNSRDTLMP